MKFILKYVPLFIQNCLISIYNTAQYRIRHSGEYQYYRNYYLSFENKSYSELKEEHERRLGVFLCKTTTSSNWYKKYDKCKSLRDFPVLNKSDIIKNLYRITTLTEKDSITSLTGGTTGASMKVLYTKSNIQERHALLDHFRAGYGYSLGEKCAWFSGKNIVTDKDLQRGVCYRDDYINKIRFFSTFHITEKNFDTYWQALCEFLPQYVVGFPSSVYEICIMAQTRGLKLKGVVKAFFPTAETLLPIHRDVIMSVFGCRIADQYASSEGAPFILECKRGRLHIHALTGVFEVVDENMEPTDEGEVLVTSFTTEGTPLIRYRVGDRIKLTPEDVQCECGSHFPLVEYIEGRTTDFIMSPTHGKVNLGNISNCTKGIKGIIQFQVIQYEIDKLKVLVVTSHEFSYQQKNKFLNALVERFGSEMKISLQLVNNIAKEKSGKFRLVKNLIK